MKIKDKVKHFVLPLSPVLFVVLGCLVIRMIAEVNSFLHRNDWKELTTPLPRNKVEVLCKSFELDKSHELCNDKKDVYGPDFYDLIWETFKPELTYQEPDKKPAAYDQVEEKIGAFKIDCEPIAWMASENKSYFRCIYDLRGDGTYIMVISYRYPENTVYRIMTPLRNDIENP